MQQHSEQLERVLPSKYCFSLYEHHPLPYKSALNPPPNQPKWGQSTPQLLSLCSPQLFVLTSLAFSAADPSCESLAHLKAAGKIPRCPGESAGRAVTGHPSRYCQRVDFYLGNSAFPSSHQLISTEIFIFPRRVFVSCLLTLWSPQIPTTPLCTLLGRLFPRKVLPVPQSRGTAAAAQPFPSSSVCHFPAPPPPPPPPKKSSVSGEQFPAELVTAAVPARQLSTCSQLGTPLPARGLNTDT